MQRVVSEVWNSKKADRPRAHLIAWPVRSRRVWRVLAIRDVAEVPRPILPPRACPPPVQPAWTSMWSGNAYSAIQASCHTIVVGAGAAKARPQDGRGFADFQRAWQAAVRTHRAECTITAEPGGRSSTVVDPGSGAVPNSAPSPVGEQRGLRSAARQMRRHGSTLTEDDGSTVAIAAAGHAAFSERL